MSVESSARRVSRGGGLVVRPQPIRFLTVFSHLKKVCSFFTFVQCFKDDKSIFICSDKSYVESVVSFLHDVVPQASLLDHEKYFHRVIHCIS